MSTRISFLNSSLADWNDYDLADLKTDLLSAGVANLSADGSDLEVVEKSGGADMSVDVKPGRVYLPITKNSQTYMVRLENKDTENLEIAANSSGDTRVDAIIARVSVSEDPNEMANNIGTLEVVTGTGITALSDSAIQTEIGGDGSYRLADISVANSATEIASSAITDKRSALVVGENSVQYKTNFAGNFSGDFFGNGAGLANLDLQATSLYDQVVDNSHNIFELQLYQTDPDMKGLIYDDFKNTNYADVASTTTSAGASSGQRVVPANSVSGFSTNQEVTITDGTNMETKEIDSVSQSGGVTMLDANNSGGTGGNSPFGSTTFRGQSFTTSSTTTQITKVGVELKYNTGTRTDIAVEIYLADGDQKPTGSALGSATITSFGDTAYIWKDAIFSAPASVSPNTKYVMVIKSTGSAASAYHWHSSGSDTYANGKSMWSSDGGGTWTTNDSDMEFKTYKTGPSIVLENNLTNTYVSGSSVKRTAANINTGSQWLELPSSPTVGKNYNYYSNKAQFSQDIENAICFLTRSHPTLTTGSGAASGNTITLTSGSNFANGDTIEIYNATHTNWERFENVTISGNTITLASGETLSNSYTDATVNRIDIIPNVSIVQEGTDEDFAEKMVWSESRYIDSTYNEDIYTKAVANVGKDVVGKVSINTNNVSNLPKASKVGWQVF